MKWADFQTWAYNRDFAFVLDEDEREVFTRLSPGERKPKKTGRIVHTIMSATGSLVTVTEDSVGEIVSVTGGGNDSFDGAF